MVQALESGSHGLGEGQQLERDLAKRYGLPIFVVKDVDGEFIEESLEYKWGPQVDHVLDLDFLVDFFNCFLQRMHIR